MGFAWAGLEPDQWSKLTSFVSKQNDAPTATGFSIISQGEANLIRNLVGAFIPSEVRKLTTADPAKRFDEYLNRVGQKSSSDFKLIMLAIDGHFFLTEQISLKLGPVEPSRVAKVLQKIQVHKDKRTGGLFRFAKFLATQPIYSDPAIWKAIGYSGPWVQLDQHSKPIKESRNDLAFSLYKQCEDRLELLKRNLISITDIDPQQSYTIVIGSGPGGAVAAAELARNRSKGVVDPILILEKGQFVHPDEFSQRDDLMVPRLYETEFSASSPLQLGMVNLPDIETLVIKGKLVGGSATINHALCFELPEAIRQEWQSQFGFNITPQELEEHYRVLREEMAIKRVASSQVNRNNAMIALGAKALGWDAHSGPAERNVKECRSCGFCDIGCRYNRKQTPLLVHLPNAVQYGAKIVPNCEVQKIEFSKIKNSPNSRTQQVQAVVVRETSLPNSKPVKIKASLVILAAGALDSPRVLQRSGIGPTEGLNIGGPNIRNNHVGRHLTTHAPMPIYGLFDHAIFQNLGGPPMSYFMGEFSPDNPKADVPEPISPNQSKNYFKFEGTFNHPSSQAQLLSFADPTTMGPLHRDPTNPESQATEEWARFHWELMKNYNYLARMTMIFRDSPNGEVKPNSFLYHLQDEDKPQYLRGLKVGAQIYFGAGAKQVHFAFQNPVIINRQGSLTATFQEIEKKLTMDVLARHRVFINTAHPMGGCRMGANPQESVVDPNGESWNIANLYITDASIFPTSTAANPTLTICALSRVIAHRLLKKLGIT